MNDRLATIGRTTNLDLVRDVPREGLDAVRPFRHVVLRVPAEEPHLVPAGEQLLHGRASHNACAASHKNSHPTPPRIPREHLADAGPKTRDGLFLGLVLETPPLSTQEEIA